VSVPKHYLFVFEFIQEFKKFQEQVNLLTKVKSHKQKPKFIDQREITQTKRQNKTLNQKEYLRNKLKIEVTK